MTKQPNSPSPKPERRRARGADRRTATHAGPPPFRTRDGLVMTDRRSPCDRRAEWLREFRIDVDEDSE